MRIVFIYFLLLINLQVLGQSKKENQFPKCWEGNWIGKLQIYKDTKVVQEIEMELEISATDSVNRWKWIIRYGLDGKDVRNYELIVKDASKGNYMIDEKNSILLNAKYTDNKLISIFDVQQTLLICIYEMQADTIKFQVLSTSTKNQLKSGGSSEENPEVASFQNISIQKAILKKK